MGLGFGLCRRASCLTQIGLFNRLERYLYRKKSFFQNKFAEGVIIGFREVATHLWLHYVRIPVAFCH